MKAPSDTETASQPLPPPGAAGGVGRAPAPYRHEEWRPAGENFKSIPATKEQRELLRRRAAEAAARLPRERAPDKQTLYAAAAELLQPLGYDRGFIGFTMVLLNNEYWRREFAAVPFEKRLFLLPQCLRQAEDCPAKVDETQLHCLECGLCSIAELSGEARSMGYRVLIAEGTPGVLKLLMAGRADAILGVACLNVLEKAFDKVLQLGIPALAIPLLRDSCHNTAVDEDWVRAALMQAGTPAVVDCGAGILPARKIGAGGAPAPQSQAGTLAPQQTQAGTPALPATRSFVPLLREVSHYFDEGALEQLLLADRSDAPAEDKVAETERLALAWLHQGGKRSRPFVTAGAWQALTNRDEVPLHVKRMAVAMEVFHKASLIHDDIEDGDDFRYETAAAHKVHTVPVALNIGDYLIGRGYRLVTEQEPCIGAEKLARVLRRLTQAHVALCEGQGAELLWRNNGVRELEPLECLRLYALKTTPAFAAALHTGLILGGDSGQWDAEAASFTKHAGVAFQIQNDLQELNTAGGNFGDLLKGRPTLLFALALEAAGAAEKAELLAAARAGAGAGAPAARLREIYLKHEVPLKAAQLAENQRVSALRAAAGVRHEGLRAFFMFLAALLLD
ncbi:MAG: DUF116 domain-containing protein [Planctomycetota bacterium]